MHSDPKFTRSCVTGVKFIYLESTWYLRWDVQALLVAAFSISIVFALYIVFLSMKQGKSDHIWFKILWSCDSGVADRAPDAAVGDTESTQSEVHSFVPLQLLRIIKRNIIVLGIFCILGMLPLGVLYYHGSNLYACGDTYAFMTVLYLNESSEIEW